MHHILQIDWQALLVPSMSLLELVLRGSVTYLLILAAFRVLRREAGALGTADLLVVVLVADAAQNAMSSQYNSLTEGAVLVGTIFAWNYLLDWLAYRSRWVYRLLHPSPLPLIEDGRVKRSSLRSEMLTLGDLKQQLREQGVEDIGQVKRCYLEPDGRLSVIRRDPEGGPQPQRRSTIV